MLLPAMLRLSSLLLVLCLVPSSLFAQKAPAAKGKKQEVLTVREVTIVGRVQKPVAAVDVSKIQTELTLSDLKHSFVDKIPQALRNSSF